MVIPYCLLSPTPPLPTVALLVQSPWAGRWMRFSSDGTLPSVCLPTSSWLRGQAVRDPTFSTPRLALPVEWQGSLCACVCECVCNCMYMYLSYFESTCTGCTCILTYLYMYIYVSCFLKLCSGIRTGSKYDASRRRVVDAT